MQNDNRDNQASHLDERLLPVQQAHAVAVEFVSVRCGSSGHHQQQGFGSSADLGAVTAELSMAVARSRTPRQQDATQSPGDIGTQMAAMVVAGTIGR